MKYSDIDIIEINKIYFTSFRWMVKDKSWIRIIGGMIKIFVKLFLKPQPSINKTNHVIFYFDSLNNKRALEPIYSKMDNSMYSNINYRLLSKPIIFFKSLVYFPYFIKTYIKQNRENRMLIKHFWLEFIFTYGTICAIEKLVKRNNINLVVLANDHSMRNRCFLYIAKQYGIKTLYTQHCSVTERFPELQFTYSFLDGEESLIKYCKCGIINSNIYLSGNPRFDEISKIKKEPNSKCIGVALNYLDKIDNVKILCNMLINNGYNVIVRPHPRYALNDSEWFTKCGISISDSKTESPFVFLSKISGLIAGECGIHFDAIMMDIKTILYNMSVNAKILDWYSYVKNGLIPVANDMYGIINLLSKNNSVSIEKAQWYNAAYNRNISGHIGEMIADFIGYIQRNEDISNFDKKYSFTKKIVNGYEVKVYEK